jgi:DNA-binding HxlR family transcriptional regulator
MKSYDQLCAVARALDVVGDRWNLLIVRELLIHRGARFTDLLRGLPGIAPNLLAGRLQDLAAGGVVRKETVTGQSAGHEYRLTERGRELDGVIRELLKWGAPTVPQAPDSATFQMHWLSMPAKYLLHDNEPTAPAITVRFGDPADGFDAHAHDGTIDIGPCEPDLEPAATIAGPGQALVGFIQGAIPLEHADRAGITITGNSDSVGRILPHGR